MAIALYMNAHIPKAITVGLRLRDVDVITAQEDKADILPDPDLIDRATILQRVLFTFDDDMLVEATRRQQEGLTHKDAFHLEIEDLCNCIDRAKNRLTAGVLVRANAH